MKLCWKSVAVGVALGVAIWMAVSSVATRKGW